MWELQCVGVAVGAGFGARGCGLGELGSAMVAVCGGCHVVVAVWEGCGVGKMQCEGDAVGKSRCRGVAVWGSNCGELQYAGVAVWGVLVWGDVV